MVSTELQLFNIDCQSYLLSSLNFFSTDGALPSDPPKRQISHGSSRFEEFISRLAGLHKNFGPLLISKMQSMLRDLLLQDIPNKAPEYVLYAVCDSQ